MLYPEIFKKLEFMRWSMEDDVPWEQFDETQISDRQLYSIKMNAILEWSAMSAAEMFLRLSQHDADFSAFISIWFFEEQKHSLTLLEYLRRFAPKYLPTEDELAAVRFSFDSAPLLESLASHFCSEVRLNQWYRCAHDWHTEPVIKQIYMLLSNDEAKHARIFFDYMKRAIEQKGQEALLAFSKIGVLETNFHMNKSMFPGDRVKEKFPDPNWLKSWLNDEICFDDNWEKKVNRGVLSSLSSLFQISFNSAQELREYRKTLASNSDGFTCIS